MFLRKKTILLLAFLWAVAVNAQDKFTLSFDHMALCVKDVDRSADFYTSVLMLPEITNRSAIKGIRWFALSDGRELHLISVIRKKIFTNKAIHLGITANDFEAVLKRVIQQNIPYSDWIGKSNSVNIRADGVKQIYFQDPDGYWIEINSVGKAKVSHQ